MDSLVTQQPTLSDNCLQTNDNEFRCAGCKHATYCNINCQKRDWKYHKFIAIGLSTWNHCSNTLESSGRKLKKRVLCASHHHTTATGFRVRVTNSPSRAWLDFPRSS
eukprot:scaffold34595_cov160-Amphora_coffeaeformis.AAC.10